jgi:hypothetical protein
MKKRTQGTSADTYKEYLHARWAAVWGDVAMPTVADIARRPIRKPTKLSATAKPRAPLKRGGGRVIEERTKEILYVLARQHFAPDSISDKRIATKYWPDKDIRKSLARLASFRFDHKDKIGAAIVELKKHE